MLIQFTVSNFLSFKDEQAFSMVAASGKNDNELMDNTFKSTVDERITLLRSAAMYGANASGKSDFIKALSFYFAFILRSTESLDGGLLSDQKTFLLDKETTGANSKFEAILELKGAIYRYGYIVHEQLVVREWLFCTEQGKQRRRERQLFERDVQANLVKGAGFAKYAQITAKNSLLLTVAAQAQYELVQNLVGYIKNLVTVDSHTGLLLDLTIKYLYSRQERVKDYDDVLELLKAADLNIEGFRIIKQESAGSLHVMVKHKCLDKESNFNFVEFDLLQHESLGTIKIFALSLMLIARLREGGIMIVDELEHNLHPLLVKKIIELFNNPQTNPYCAQLIFTTHYDGILNREIFRRDQIWFADKSRSGATSIYSLVQFKNPNNAERKDASYDKRYLEGRYGAIPVFSDYKLRKSVFGDSDADR